jgi:hypothetical protein
MNPTPTAHYHSRSLQRAALLAASCAVGMIGGDELPMLPYLPMMDPTLSYGYGPRGGTRSRGKVRDTKAASKPRRKERRSARHTQRRRK